MIKPLALVAYENLLPGTQLVNRLRDLGYRVEVVHDPKLLVQQAIEAKPIVILADLEFQGADLRLALEQVRTTNDTQHIPVLAFVEARKLDQSNEAIAAGASMVVSTQAVLAHLPELLDQVLQIE